MHHSQVGICKRTVKSSVNGHPEVSPYESLHVNVFMGM